MGGCTCCKNDNSKLGYDLGVMVLGIERGVGGSG